MVFQISGIVEQKIASTLLWLGRVKGITQYIVIRLKECRIFAPCLKESMAPINSKLHSRFCKMSPSYAYPFESHAPIAFLSRKWAFVGSSEVCIHTSLLHTVCWSLNHICLLRFNDNRSWIMHDWTGIHLVLLRFLVLCQYISFRLRTLLGCTNTQPPCNCPLIKTITGLLLNLQSITVLRQGASHLNTTSSTSAMEVQSRCTLPVQRSESASAPPTPRSTVLFAREAE